MPLLGAVKVGGPDAQPMADRYIAHHAGRAAIADHMDHHLVVLEHPVPITVVRLTCNDLSEKRYPT
jgi:hypothetical protein